jgi:hypothetical protein
MLMMIAQSAFDNADCNDFEANFVLMGGGFNGKTPAWPYYKDDDGKQITMSIQKTNDCYLYTSAIEGLAQTGLPILYDNQLHNTPVVKRIGTIPGQPSVPINPIFGASLIFKHIADNTCDVETLEFRNAKRELMGAKTAAKLANNYDLCSVSYMYAVNDQPSLEKSVDKVKQIRLKPEPIIETIINISQHVCDVWSALSDYNPSTHEVDSARAQRGADDSDDDMDKNENNDSESSNEGSKGSNWERGTGNRTSSISFKDYVVGEIKTIQDGIWSIAKYTNMSGATSCLSILIHQRYTEIKELGMQANAPMINRFLALAAQQPQTPLMAKNHMHLKQSDLQLIVENFGAQYNDGMMTMVREGNYLTDSDIESGLASVEFKGSICRQGVCVRNMMEHKDGLDINNILHAQEAWTCCDWISNIDHMKEMGYSDEQFRQISMILWVKMDPVYTHLKKVITDGNLSSSDSNNKSDEEDNESG